MSTTKTLKYTTEAVKQHRKALLELRSEVGTLEQLITEHEIALGSLESTEETQALGYVRLQREREDVLADIALGRKSDADLAAVDRRISDATNSKRTSMSAKDAVEFLRVEQSLEGLRRRRNEAAKELLDTEELTSGIVKEFLVATAAEAYASYLANAGKTVADLKRLIALSSIFEKTTGDKSNPFTQYYWSSALLPTFNLPHDGTGAYSGSAGILFKADIYLNTAEPESVMDAEAERLRATGVFDLI